VVSVETTHEAERVLEYAIPDLIFFDGALPVTDGSGLCKIITSDGIFDPVPVVFIASSLTAMAQGQEEDAPAFIMPPIQREVLLAQVNAVARFKRLTDQRDRALMLQGERIDSLTNENLQLQDLLEHVGRHEKTCHNTAAPKTRGGNARRLMGFMSEMGKGLKQRKSERGIIQTATDAIVSVGSDHRVVIWNDAAVNMFGYPASQMIGQPVDVIHPTHIRPSRREELERFLRTGEPSLIGKTIEVVAVKKDGVALDAPDGTHCTGVIRDITERMQADEAMRGSQQIIEGIINSIPVRVFWKDKNLVYLGCNTAFARDAGFADPKDIIGKDDYQMGWHAQAELYRNDDRQVIESRCPKLLVEELQTTPQGNTISLLTSKIPLRDSRGQISGVLGTYLDITERKKALDHIEILSRFPAENPNPVMRVTSEGVLLYSNDASEPLLALWNISVGQVMPDDWCARIEGVSKSGQGTGIEVRSGELVFECILAPVAGACYVNLYGRDITERKQAEEALHASLKEKDVLLKEVHHRVKNNLQVISSLLSLQERVIDIPDARFVLRESQARVRSMALVHEKLYQSNDLAHVDFGDYLRHLVSFLLRTYQSNGRDITVEIEANSIRLGIEAAIPCGLIVNELVSNGLKHAFRDRERGTIRISMEKHDDQFTLTVADDGVGFPQNIDVHNATTLGFELVENLTKQLDGTLDIASDGGTAFRLTFSEVVFPQEFAFSKTQEGMT
jgi:PAS domain S-box-containing protein